MKITIQTTITSDLPTVWAAWIDPEDIMQWNAASDDWHTTAASVDFQVGGGFRSRMEARDGSMGFDFAGTYTRIDDLSLIEFELDDGRPVTVEFSESADGVVVTETFEAENENAAELQRQGWQAILDNFARHVEAK